MPVVHRLVQRERVEDYRAALFSVARSILVAMLDGLGRTQLEVIQETERGRVKLGQLAWVARLPRDKGARGDGFEWAVHAAVADGDSGVCGRLARAMCDAAEAARGDTIHSVLFGYERARNPEFLREFLSEMGAYPRLLPGGRGRSAPIGDVLSSLVDGPRADLPERFASVWKADMFLSAEGSDKWLAATVKSNPELLEGGSGLRVGVVAEWPDWPASDDLSPTRLDDLGLIVAVLPDHDGFVRVFNDGYAAVAEALRVIGQHPPEWVPHYLKPTVVGQEIARELTLHASTPVVEIVDELGLYGQRGLITPDRRRFSVPGWLRNNRMQPFVATARPLDFGRFFRTAV